MPAVGSALASVGATDSGMIAVLADIHGNLPGLEAALADLRTYPVTSVLCLGDVSNFGPSPRETLRRVRGLPYPTRFVLGNTDAYLLKPRTAADVRAPTEDTPFILEVEAWCAEQLGDDDRGFLHDFEPVVRESAAGLDVVAYHGSPRSYDDPIRATTTDDELAEMLDHLPAGLYLGAHTHEQFVRRYRAAVVASPGSVGLPLSVAADGKMVHPVLAEYALVEVRHGIPNVSLRRVPYELDELRELVEASGMPHSERWFEGFVAATEDTPRH
ncbi:MAG: metallophosphoesterase family protein [Trueperaceae bacterium]